MGVEYSIGNFRIDVWILVCNSLSFHKRTDRRIYLVGCGNSLGLGTWYCKFRDYAGLIWTNKEHHDKDSKHYIYFLKESGLSTFFFC